MRPSLNFFQIWPLNKKAWPSHIDNIFVIIALSHISTLCDNLSLTTIVTFYCRRNLWRNVTTLHVWMWRFTRFEPSSIASRQVSTSPTFYEQLFIRKCFWDFCVLTVWVCNFLLKENRSKNCSLNVGKIDLWSQFHQHFTRKFFIRKCFVQLFSG